MQEDDDAFEVKPKKVKERGALTSDVHSRTVESCKPVLAQASNILVGPEFDRATGVHGKACMIDDLLVCALFKWPRTSGALLAPEAYRMACIHIVCS